MGFTGVVMVSPRPNKWSCSRVHPISRVLFIPSFLGEVIINTIYNDHTGFFKHPRIRPPKAFSPATRIVNEAVFFAKAVFCQSLGCSTAQRIIRWSSNHAFTGLAKYQIIKWLERTKTPARTWPRSNASVLEKHVTFVPKKIGNYVYVMFCLLYSTLLQK